jgi:hypothetical protein
MDPVRFDTLARTLSTTGTRRTLLRLLAAMSVACGVFALLEETTIAGNGHKGGKGKSHHGHKGKSGRSTSNVGAPAPGCTPTCPARVCGDVDDGCGSTIACVCSGSTPVCDGGTCRACRANRECCGAPASGQWCQGEACVPARGSLADCQGRCGGGQVTICGQAVTCADCDCDSACAGSSEDTCLGPAGDGQYCAAPTAGEPCVPQGLIDQCRTPGEFCCFTLCRAICS